MLFTVNLRMMTCTHKYQIVEGAAILVRLSWIEACSVKHRRLDMANMPNHHTPVINDHVVTVRYRTVIT